MNEHHFQKILKMFNDEDCTKLNHVLLKWISCSDWQGRFEFEKCNHQRIIENLKEEHFLPDSEFKEILFQLIAHSNDEIIEILDKLKSQIQDNFLLKGGPVWEEPVVCATATVKSIFENFLSKNNFSKDEIQNFLDKDPSDYNFKERNSFMKFENRLIWLTWDEFVKNDPYFFLMNLNSENLCDSMALDDFYRNKVLLLFFFRLEKGLNEMVIFRPTWCDANFFDRFKPSDPNEEQRWGLTYPLKKVDIKKQYSQRRPEGVILSSNLPCEYLNKKIKVLNV